MNTYPRCGKTAIEITIAGEHEHYCIRTPGHAVVINHQTRLDHICECGAHFELEPGGVEDVAPDDAGAVVTPLRPRVSLESVLQEELDWTWAGEPGVPSGEEIIKEIADAIRKEFIVIQKGHEK